MLADLVILLDISVGDLAAIADTDLTERSVAKGLEVAGLIWDARRLTADQLQKICEEAERMTARQS
ncbi:hypothetical protein [Planotetraspora thailandica]|uniref:hypothetical protein n=1 Tax=Planotetraspora thailandica TaxID=487172 RepID=UPI00194EE7AC|nr:hypothetical protein [Planotetraspora thailandica]